MQALITNAIKLICEHKPFNYATNSEFEVVLCWLVFQFDVQSVEVALQPCSMLLWFIFFILLSLWLSSLLAAVCFVRLLIDCVSNQNIHFTKNVFYGNRPTAIYWAIEIDVTIRIISGSCRPGSRLGHGKQQGKLCKLGILGGIGGNLCANVLKFTRRLFQECWKQCQKLIWWGMFISLVPKKCIKKFDFCAEMSENL